MAGAERTGKMKSPIILMLCLVLLVSVSATAQNLDPEEPFVWAITGESWVQISEIQKTAWLLGFLHGLEVATGALTLIAMDALIDKQEFLFVDTPVAQIIEELDQYYGDPAHKEDRVAVLILLHYCAGADRLIEAADALDEKDRAAQSLFGL